MQLDIFCSFNLCVSEVSPAQTLAQCSLTLNTIVCHYALYPVEHLYNKYSKHHLLSYLVAY